MEKPCNSARFGAIVAVVVAVGLFTFEVISLFVSPLVGTFSTDETINYYQAARNFNKLGFLKSSLLQDFSTSSDPDEHPYVYDHMAAGPEIVIALLTRLVGEHYWFTRLFFAGLFVWGLYYYYRFAAILLSDLGLSGAGAGYAFLLITLPKMMYLLDSPGHATFPLLAFYPLVAMHHWHTTGKSLTYWSALAAVLLSTLLLPYQQVILILACAFFLGLFKLTAVTKRDALAFAIMAAAGVLLHIGQNVWHLGVDVALKELCLTIANRMTGHPTGQELVDFYQSINVVHHGTHTLRPRLLLGAFVQCFNERVLKMMAVIGAMALGCVGLARILRKAAVDQPAQSASDGRNLTKLARLAAWCVASVAVPVFAFPAYAVDYNLQGTGQFLGAIVGVAFFGYVLQAVRLNLPSPFGRGAGGEGVPKWLVVAYLAGAGLVFAVFLERQAASAIEVGKQALTNNFAFVEQIRAHTKNQVTMSNLYPTFVGFFTEEKVFGVAEREAFFDDGTPNPHGAYNKFIPNLKSSDHYHPTYYILSRVLLPGYAKSANEDYYEELRGFLLTYHRRVYEDDSLAIFELNYPHLWR